MGNSQTSPQPPKSVVWLLPTQAPISEQCGVGGWRGGGSRLAARYLPRDMSSLPVLQTLTQGCCQPNILEV